MDLRRTGRSGNSASTSLSYRIYALNFATCILSSLFLLLLVVGSYDYFNNVEQNKCEMTWMFEFPQYTKIGLNSKEDKNYPMYGLYAYSEGKHVEAVRNLKFTGIPVLFLPGNAGSYKQVRSFASVALRKWLNGRTPYHFDFFSLDFNEEISGVYGYVLERQTEYARLAVNRIMSFYEDFHHVVIIGHSMGGVIGKTLIQGDSKAEMIFTLATPHLQPLVIADPETDLFYYYVSRNWTQLRRQNLKDVTLVSLAGGDRDLIISSKLTRWNYNNIHTSTKALPTAWASTDHLCIVWCKQVVMAVVRSLFDMVELKKKIEYYAITQNTTLREQVLNYHILKRTSGKSYHSAHPNEVSGVNPPAAVWTEHLVPDYCQASSNKLTFVMFPMKIFEKGVGSDFANSRLLVTTSNTKPKNWIFGCKSQSFVNGVRICSKLQNLSNQTQLIPSYHRRRKIIHLNYEALKDFSHLVVKLDPVNFKACVNVDAYNVMARLGIVGDKFQTQNKMYYNLRFPLLTNISRIFAWKVSVKLNEPDSKCEGHHNSVGIFEHGAYRTHNFFKNESLLVRFTDWTAKDANVELYLDQRCKYTVSCHAAFVETAGQIFRTYWHLLPSHFTSIILMSLAFQPASGWYSFPRILLRNAYYLTILPGFVVALSLLFLPNDFPMMMDEEEYTTILSFGLYLTTFPLALGLGFVTYYVLATAGNTYHALLVRFFTRKLGNVPEKVTEFALGLTLDKFPITIAVLVIAIALASCGAMGFAVGLFFFLVKIFKSYQDILDDLLKKGNVNLGEIFSTSNFHFHCAMLWFVVTALNLPSLLYWIHNFRFDEPPQWDLSLYLCLMLTPALAILWQGFVPAFNPRLWKIQRCMCYLTGLFAVIWGSHRLYLMSFLIVVVILSIAGCQLISLMAPVESEEPGGRPPQGNSGGNADLIVDDVSNSSEEEEEAVSDNNFEDVD